MELYINGQQVHICKGDVVLNWQNIRWSDDAVGDQWSTEVELPNDEWNINLIDAYGLLDRGAIFNKKVKCQVLVEEIAKDGYLQVLEITENTIKARVFVIVIPYEVLDKKVCEYYPHEDVVFRWDRFSPIVTNIAGVDEGIIPYDYTSTDFYSNFLAQWHASVNVGKIIDNIQISDDITLPAVYPSLWQLASRKKVCPSNPYQVMMGNLLHGDAISDKDLELCGGQHITNDFKSRWTYADLHWNYDWSDWLVESTNEKWMENSSKMSVIKFNRHCVAHIKIYACASQIGGILIPRRNGESLSPAPASAVPVLTDYNWNIGDILMFDDYVAFEDGDEFALHYSGSAQSPKRNVRYTVVMEYEDYEWGEDDYDEDLVYIPAPFGIWGIIRLTSDFAYDFKCDFSGDGFGTNPLDYSFTYFGAYSNLERETTVREYLTSLCWVHNQKLKLDRNELIFQNANQKKAITSNITTITPSSDKLGQTNTICYRDSDEPTEFKIDNEFLENEKTLHESIFYTGDVIPQYSYEMTYSEKNNDEGNQWITDINVKFEDFDAVIMTAVQTSEGYKLYRAPVITGFGLPDLTNSQQISAQTRRDISNLDYVYIDGHKYMLIDGEFDLETFITDFNAIQCDSTFGCIPPVFAVIDTEAHKNSITIVYSYTDITGESTGTMTMYDTERPRVTIVSIDNVTYTTADAIVDFSDGGSETEISSKNITKGVGSVTFDNLVEGKTYRIVCTITNECGEDLEYQYVIDTPEFEPPVVSIWQIYNIGSHDGMAKVGFYEQ